MTKARKLAHIYFVVFAFMGNLVPITIDMVSGRHLELKNGHSENHETIIIQNILTKKVQKLARTNYTICRFTWILLQIATDMISGRHHQFKNGRRECLNGHISEYIWGEPKLVHMYYVLYRLICNLVPFATDMIYGRHLGFQNYPIIFCGNVIQLTCTLIWQAHSIRLPRMFSLCWQHVRTWETHSLKTVETCWR